MFGNQGSVNKSTIDERNNEDAALISLEDRRRWFALQLLVQ